jgi:RHS repeat-associated protein
MRCGSMGVMLRIIGAVLLAAVSASAQPWTTGTIGYDGAGNIVSMGSDVYVYDSAGRLIKGTADQQRTGGTNRQEYSYDAFGNRLTRTTVGSDCAGGCPNITVNISTSNAVPNNRISSVVYPGGSTSMASYDTSGNLTGLDGYTYSYDGAGMVAEQSNPSNGIDWQFVYSADDERLATYTGQGSWRFTVRDVDGKVLREVLASQVSGTITWTWDRDHVLREGQLLATLSPSGQEQFHLDHLGTPRLVTDAGGTLKGMHTYYPFGDELNLTQKENPLERLQYTGHERDTALGVTIDYMHARFYSPTAGRFLTADPLTGSPRFPQSWNRYAYVRDNPTRYIDPLGLCQVVAEDGKTYTADDCSTEVTARDPSLENLQAAANIRAVNNLAFDRLRNDPKCNFVCQYLAWGHRTFDPFVSRHLAPPPGVKIGIVFVGDFGSTPISAAANVQNPELANLVDQMYRPTAVVGDTGTADAIRHETLTGELLSQSGHVEKGWNMATALSRLIAAGGLTPAERAIAFELVTDLMRALSGM